MGHQRYFKANNKYLPDYDPQQPSSYIMYLDANNLYGWAMSQPLPYAGFKWLSQTQLKQFTPKYISKFNPNSDLGFVLEVDLEYPEKLHDLHDDYPLAPENMVVPHEWFSEYQRELLDDNKDVSDPHVNKLTCTLNPKHKYVVHIATLKKYLELGLTLTKVHRAICFKQKP